MHHDRDMYCLGEYADEVIEIEMESDDVLVPVLLNEMPAIEEEEEDVDLPPSYETAMEPVISKPPCYAPPNYIPLPEARQELCNQYEYAMIAPHASTLPANTHYEFHPQNWAPAAMVARVH